MKVYRLLTILLWPAFFIYTIKTALRDKSTRYFLQRTGFAYPEIKHNANIYWIHCASVGEVNTYLPLHLKLLQHLPETQFLITTNTTTGASTVARNIKALSISNTRHCYLPLESGFAIRRFLKHFQIRQCLIMETEIWPLLFQMCKQKKIPLRIINARLSHRTLNTNSWIKSIYQLSLSRVDKILCKSAHELQNFQALGATEQQLVIAGNLKFTSTDQADTLTPVDLNKRNYCVAASTHNDEEQQLAKLWNTLETEHLLVIVPRHPKRSEQIQKQLQTLNIKYAVRSLQQAIEPDTKIYLADTMGELKHFMSGAQFVFIGGTLIKHGGQNLLEPARMAKTTVCGPHMFNFKDEVALLLKNDACIQVNNTEELQQAFIELLTRPEKTAVMGENARKVLSNQAEILDTYIACIID